MTESLDELRILAEQLNNQDVSTQTLVIKLLEMICSHTDAEVSQLKSDVDLLKQ